MVPFPLYFIADPLLDRLPRKDPRHEGDRPLVKTVEAAVEAGARLIQYREKGGGRRAMYETAKRLREITAGHRATLIINDEIDLALAVRADGVHLGQDDLPLWVARKVLGKGAIVGLSTHNLEQAVQAEAEGADYIGFGPIFRTGTKESPYPPLGLEAIAEVKKRVQIPLYAIGGIQEVHIGRILSSGAAGVAAISALSGDIGPNVARWIKSLESAGNLDKSG